MNRLVKKFMVVLMSAFMFLGAVTTPVQAKGPSSDNPNGWGFWWGWWWPTEPAPEPTPEPVEEPVVDEEPGEEETPVETEEPAVEEAPAAEPEPVYAEGTFFDESEHFVATVSFDATARLPEGTDVSVSELQEGTPEYDAAVKAVFGDSEAAADFIAVDIALVSNDVVVEPDPNGNEVTVSVELKNLPAEAIAAADTMEIQHVNEVSGETETVATAENITVTGEDSAQAEFAVGSFSTFVLKWGDNSATIHYGYMNGNVFKEFGEDKIALLDTTASSINLANYFDGFDYGTALLHHAETTNPWIDYVTDFDGILKKNASGEWEYTIAASDDDSSATSTGTIQNGDHIYAVYTEATSSSGHDPAPADVDGPKTTKKVTDNGDGTYEIQLDIVGTEKQDTTQTGANVMIVLDTTGSMSGNMSGGGGTRIAAARSAMTTLIDTLNCGVNDIQLSVVTFNNLAGTTTLYDWTKEYTTVRNWAATAPSASGMTGTNWEAGLNEAVTVLNNKPDDDTTYVIFITDGEPNRYVNDWTGGESNGQAGTCRTQAQPAADTLAQGSEFYGVLCGTTQGSDHLSTLVNNANGVKTIVATDKDTLESEFEGIATTIVKNLGSQDVSVDDGIPSLSSVSAQTAGEASGFVYYIKGKDDPDFSEWEDAPGASYSKDNGVTWNLSSVGKLPAGTTYRIKFTVWPSQDAYDLIADLNNGKVSMTDEELTAAGIVNEGGVYKLKTNTHLQTTYTYNGTTYTDPNTWEEEKMLLPTETISVEKLWHNYLDSRSDADIDGLKLMLCKDQEEYLEIEVNAANQWKKDNIFISCGMIASGVIKEQGHDYYVKELPGDTDDKTAYWEVDTPVYHPMVIDGVTTMLVLDEAATAEVEDQTYKIGDHYYTKHNESTTMSAINERVSWLNLTKTVTGEGAPADTLFEYKATITQPSGKDLYFSVFGDGVNYRDDVETDAQKWVDTATGNTYYIAKSGTEFTLKIKAGWNARVLNLETGSTYTFEEVTDTMAPGYIFDSVKAVETLYVKEGRAEVAPNYPKTTDKDKTEIKDTTIANEKVTGKIHQTNTDYTVTYTNKYLGYFYVYHSSDNTVVRYPIAVNGQFVYTDANPFDIVDKTYDNTLYGGYYTNYAGKSTGFNVKSLDFTDSKATDAGEGATKYDYDYIKSSNQSVWNISEANTADGEKIVPVTDAVYYLKEVPTGYLQPYLHYTYYKASNNISTAWLISAVDDNNYGESGFIIVSDGLKAQICKSLSLATTNGGKAVKLNAKRVFSGNGVLAGYLTYLKVINDSDGTADLKNGDVVKQYWVTPDKIRVTGTAQRTYTGLENKDTIVKTQEDIKSEIENLN